MTEEEKIMAYDPDAGGFGYAITILADKMVNARSPHTCCHCAGSIQIGERHRMQKGVMDNEFVSCRFCSDCCSAMAKDYDEDDCNHMEARIQMHADLEKKLWPL